MCEIFFFFFHLQSLYIVLHMYIVLRKIALFKFLIYLGKKKKKCVLVLDQTSSYKDCRRASKMMVGSYIILPAIIFYFFFPKT